MTDDDPDDDPDTEPVKTPRDGLEPRHMILKYLPPWNFRAVLEVVAVAIIVVIVFHGIGQLYGFFLPDCTRECDRPHMYLDDEVEQQQ